MLTGGSGISTSVSSVSSSILPIASIVLEILGLLVGAVIVGIFIIIVVANRAEPDETGNRPQSVYFFAVSFVALVSTILGSVVVVLSVVALIGHHSPIGNAVARAVVIGGLITVLSGALLWTHLRRGVALVGPGAANPSRRVAQSYVSSVAFLSVLILLFVTIVAVYLVFALVGPGVFGRFGGRTPTVRDLIDAVYIGLVAGIVLLTHRNLVTPGLRFFGRSNGSESESGRGRRGTRGRHASGDATEPPPLPTSSTPLPFTPPGAPPPAAPS